MSRNRLHIYLDFLIHTYANDINLLEDYNFNINLYNNTLHSTSIKPDFKTNLIKISYGTARTICSQHINKREFYFDVIASLLSHINFITKNANGYLQLYSTRLKNLRDFSKTARIGELAQGINYVFAQERLGYPYIIDCNLFLELNKPILELNNFTVPKSTPDFVVLKDDLKDTGLFESKGEASKSNNVKQKLSKALKQLRNITNPCVKNRIPSCIRFEDDSPDNNSTQNNTSINYLLISTRCGVSANIAVNIFKQHYASWFYLVGDFARASQLIGSDGLFTDLEGDNRYEFDNKNNIYWLKGGIDIFEVWNDKLNIHIHLRKHYGDMNLGIFKSVVDTLTNTKQELSSPEFNEKLEGDFIVFKDATVISLGKAEESK